MPRGLVPPSRVAVQECARNAVGVCSDWVRMCLFRFGRTFERRGSVLRAHFVVLLAE